MKILVNAKLSQHKYKDNSGYLICQDAILARTGSQEYRMSELFNVEDNTVIEVFRPYEEVFDAKAMASFENKPVTNEHPSTDVNTSNHNDLSIGFVRDIHQGKSSKGEDVMLGTLVITDENAIYEIENGIKTDLSCGYECDIIKDENGNYKQTNIRGNHIALCEQGRAGIARIVDSKVEDKKDCEYSHELARLLEQAGLDVHERFASSSYRGPAFAWITIDEGDINVAKKIAEKYAKQISTSYFKVEVNSFYGNDISLSVKDSVKDADLSTIEFLIKDEEEAIAGYEKAMNEAKEKGDEPAYSVYQHIMQEELEHIQELKDLLANDPHKEMTHDANQMIHTNDGLFSELALGSFEKGVYRVMKKSEFENAKKRNILATETSGNYFHTLEEAKKFAKSKGSDYVVVNLYRRTIVDGKLTYKKKVIDGHTVFDLMKDGQYIASFDNIKTMSIYITKYEK